MSERDSIFQRSLNAIAEGYRHHQGTAIGGTVITSGIAIEASPAPSPAKDITAAALIIAGGITAAVCSLADYFNLINDELLRSKAKNANQELPPGFHDEETTIMTAEEIASAMADFKQ